MKTKSERILQALDRMPEIRNKKVRRLYGDIYSEIYEILSE